MPTMGRVSYCVCVCVCGPRIGSGLLAVRSHSSRLTPKQVQTQTAPSVDGSNFRKCVDDRCENYVGVLVFTCV